MRLLYVCLCARSARSILGYLNILRPFKVLWPNAATYQTGFFFSFFTTQQKYISPWLAIEEVSCSPLNSHLWFCVVELFASLQTPAESIFFCLCWLAKQCHHSSAQFCSLLKHKTWIWGMFHLAFHLHEKSFFFNKQPLCWASFYR